jgi:hypothetical protein
VRPTLYQRSVELARGERRARVRTRIIERVHRAIDVEERNALAVDEREPASAGRDIGERRDADEADHRVLTGALPRVSTACRR